MDHSSHTYPLDMDMGGGSDSHGSTDMCSMNMLFTWDTTNLCVVFRWWHVKTRLQLIATLVAIVLLGMGYEYMRLVGARLNGTIAEWNTKTTLVDLTSITLDDEDTTANVDGVPLSTGSNIKVKTKLLEACFYGFQVGYSFFLMLVFMTYNGWAMLAVVVGAGLGHYMWNREVADKTRALSCH